METSSLVAHCCLPELDIVMDELLHLCNRIIYVDFDGNVLRGQITYRNDTHFCQVTDNLVQWCDQNHLEFNVYKTKQLVDFRRHKHVSDIVVGHTNIYGLSL